MISTTLSISENFVIKHKGQSARKWFESSTGWKTILGVLCWLVPTSGVTIWAAISGLVDPFQCYSISITLASLVARPVGDFWQRQVDARRVREASMDEEVCETTRCLRTIIV